jgi:uncharacterized RDD family membrane protein YckC
MEWFYARTGQQFGPVNFDALVTLLQQTQLQPTDLVWREGMPEWLPASAVPELAPHIPSTPPSIGYFNPVAEARMFSPSYAGFWLRFVAWFIDFILLAIALTAFNLFIPLMGIRGHFRPMYFYGPRFYYFFPFSLHNAIEWTAAWIYFAAMESSELQATLGKLALGLAVTDMNGQRISFARASGRYWSKLISEFTFGIGYMMAGWTQQKQALHDIVASCLVIRKRPGA